MLLVKHSRAGPIMDGGGLFVVDLYGAGLNWGTNIAKFLRILSNSLCLNFLICKIMPITSTL